MIKNNKCGIYKITNLINGLSYIGQAKNINIRWRNHKSDCYNGSDESERNPLYQDIRKYGLENFSFEVIEECKVSELDEKERYWIKYYNTFYAGYNRTEGGQNAPHPNKMTDEIFNNIINDLQNTLDNSEIIGNRYGISGRTVRGINSGEYWKKDYLTYPIRESLIDIQKKLKENKPLCADILFKQHVAKVEEIRIHGTELAKQIVERGFCAVGRDYEVSSTTVRKWCRQDSLPDTIKEIKNWYYQNTEISDPRIKKDCRRKVLQLHPDTKEIIQEFASTNDAARAFGKKQGSHITEACQLSRKCYGYHWKYVE